MSAPLKLVFDPSTVDFAVLAHSMRADEVEQFVAMSGMDHYDPELATRAFINLPGPKFLLVTEDNAPVLVGGFTPVGPGNYEAWMAAPMESWEQHWRVISKHARRLIDGFLKTDARRVQIICLASRIKARCWYERTLKMEFEGVLRGYCGGGQDAAIYSKLRG